MRMSHRVGAAPTLDPMPGGFLLRTAMLLGLGVALASAVSSCGSGSGKVAGAVSSVVTQTSSTEPNSAPSPVTVTSESTVTHVTTATLQQTVSTTIPAPAAAAPATTTGTGGDNSSGIRIVIAFAVAFGAIVLITRLLRDRHKPAADAPNEVRQQQLFTAVESWKTQGWAIESENDEEATLANGTGRMLVHVDPEGHVSTHRLADA